MTVATIQPVHQSAWLTKPLDETGSRSLSMEEALVEAGLQWNVEKAPAMHMVNGSAVPVPGKFVVRREDTLEPFGVVGGTWHATQNRDAFQIVEDLLGLAGGSGTPAHIETALPLQGGKKVIVMVRLDEGLQIAGEEYRSYLSIVNGFDGRTSIVGMTHDVRYVCQNGQIGALMAMGKDTTNVVRVRHTRNAGDRIKDAMHLLGLRNRVREQLAQQGEWLAEQPMSDADFDGFLRSLMPIQDEDTDSPAKTMITQRREAVQRVYEKAENLAPIRGTRWGAFQSVLEYADHGRDFKSTDTQIKAQLGLTPQDLKVEAFRILKDPKLRPLALA